MLRIKVTNFIRQIIHKTWDIIFPRYCLACGQEGEQICSECLLKLPEAPPTLNEDKIMAVFDYDAPVVKKIIWSLKYKRGLILAKALAPCLHEALWSGLEEQGLLEHEIILIPVPLSQARQRERGYNQSAELAKQVWALNPKNLTLDLKLVKKIKNTKSQVSCPSRESRLRNLHHAFALNLPSGQKLSPQKIFVLVDDVSTTGATLAEIKKVLHQAGARRVWSLVLAHS